MSKSSKALMRPTKEQTEAALDVQAPSRSPAQAMRDRKDLLMRTFMPQGGPADPQAREDEFEMVVSWAERSGMDLFSGDVWLSRDRNGKIRIQSTIDGFRKVGMRAGGARMLRFDWAGSDGVWKDVWVSQDPPAACRCILETALGRIERVVAWSEFVQEGRNGIKETWRKMPSHMLAKVAESHAWRTACPEQLGRVYTDDELPPETSERRRPDEDERDHWVRTQTATRVERPSPDPAEKRRLWARLVELRTELGYPPTPTGAVNNDPTPRTTEEARAAIELLEEQLAARDGGAPEWTEREPGEDG